jgi:hypothetical protein
VYTEVGCIMVQRPDVAILAQRLTNAADINIMCEMLEAHSIKHMTELWECIVDGRLPQCDGISWQKRPRCNCMSRWPLHNRTGLQKGCFLSEIWSTSLAALPEH